MKSILILPYAYPPFNHISAQRPKSFADHFAANNLYPLVVTRHYTETGKSYEDSYLQDSTPASVIEEKNYTEIRLPYKAKRYNFLNKIKIVPGAEKLAMTAYAAFGHLHIKTGIDELAFDFLSNYLKENKVNYILVTSPPLNSIRLGYRLSKKFNIPLVVDFRDLWDNMLLNDNYSPGLSKKLQNSIETFYLKKWLKHAKLITAVSQPILDIVKKIAPEPAMIVTTNGFEKELFEAAALQYNQKTSFFNFSVIGTIYPQQDLGLLFEGMHKFLSDKKPGEVILNFVGTGYSKEVGEKIAANLPAEFISVSGRVPREEALQKMMTSHVLFHAGWKGFKGIASGKIFEYIASGKKILIAPGDNDIMQQIVEETKTGKIAETPEQVTQYMQEWFDEWKRTGELAYTGDYEKVLQYSREKQAGKLVRTILNL